MDFCCPERVTMELNEQLLFSPWRKWRKFGRFPVKFTLHIVLAILIYVEVTAFANETHQYSFDQQEAFVHFFLPEGALEPKITTTGNFVFYHYTVDSLLESLRTTIHNFCNLEDISLDSYGSGSSKSIEMRVDTFVDATVKTLNYDESMNKGIERKFCAVSEDDLGPFNSSASTRQTLDKLSKVDLHFFLDTANIRPRLPKCVRWEVSDVFDFNNRGGVILEYLVMEPSACDNVVSLWKSMPSALTWIPFIVIFLSLFSVGLTVAQLFRSFRVYCKTRRHHLRREYHSGPQYHRVEFKNLPWRDKLRFFNLWFFVTVLSAVLNISSSIMLLASLSYKFGDKESVSAFLGFASMFACLNLVRYFEFTPKFYLLIMALNKGMPNVIRFVIGVMPIFVGYGLLGTMLFGSYTRYFSSLDNACVTLFAVLNGDVLHDTFDYVYSQNRAMGIISRIYMYTFICLFIYAVLNIFILIMEEAFFSVKEGGGLDSRNSLVRDFVIPVVQKARRDSFKDLTNADGDTDSVISMGDRTITSSRTTFVETTSGGAILPPVLGKLETGDADMPQLLGSLESLHYQLRRRNRFTQKEKLLLKKLEKYSAILLRYEEQSTETRRRR